MNIIQYKIWLKKELDKIYNNNQTSYLKDLFYFIYPDLSEKDFLFFSKPIPLKKIKYTKKLLIYLNLTKLPIPYLTGFTYFDDIKIILNKKTFIPRSNTLEIVIFFKELISLIPHQSSICIDLCSGSGAIAFYLKKNLPLLDLICLEKKKAPINAIIKTKKLNKLNIDVYQSNLLNFLIKNKIKFQFLISNPPYIDQQEVVSPIVLHEPKTALFTNKILIYKKIFKQLNNNVYLIQKPFFFIFEINYQFINLLKKEVKRYQIFSHCYFLKTAFSQEANFLLISSLNLEKIIPDLLK